jgi:predicted MPP superfamily phosphohydrolase
MDAMPISRRAVLKGLVGGGASLVGGPAAYGFLYARRQLAVTRTTLPVVDLAPALEGLRIGLVTDIHRSHWVSGEDIAHAAATLAAEHTDLIVLGGDYVTWGDRDYVEPAAEALSGLQAPHGVFGILGNHDDDHDMPAALGRRGVEMLKDARTSVKIRGERLDLVGIRYWTRRVDQIRGLVDRPARTVLLAHDPRRLSEAAALGIPIVLSGHTHGGQIVLPILGAVAAEKFPVVAGLGRRRQTTIFVSRGVGTVYVPVRLNCPPEVAVLTLARADESAAVQAPPAV